MAKFGGQLRPLAEEEVIRKLASGLTSTEASELTKVVEEVEKLLFDRTFRAIYKWMAVAVSVVGVVATGVGILLLISLRDAVVLRSSELLSANAELKSQVTAKVSDDIEVANGQLVRIVEIVDRAKQLDVKLATAEMDLEVESGRAAAALKTDLHEINTMLQQLKPYFDAMLKQQASRTRPQ